MLWTESRTVAVMRFHFFLSCVALASLGCGQTTSGNDAGPDGESLDVITSGCTNGTVQSYPVDASACSPQLESTYTCGGSICNWNVIIPCDADAGGDDAGVNCLTVCAAVQPTGPHSPPGFCQPPVTTDAGTRVNCGGCGV